MKIEYDADDYIVSETELKIMLTGLGYEHAFGLFSPEEQTRQEETRENVLKIIVSMLNDRKIKSDGEKILICKPLEEIVRIIGEAERSALMSLLGEESQLCCYFSSQTAICETVAYQPKMFRLSKSDPKSVAERIVNSGIYPEGYENSGTDEERNLWEKSGIKVLTAEFFNGCEPEAKLEVEFPAIGQAEIIISGDGPTVCTRPFGKDALYESLLDLMERA